MRCVPGGGRMSGVAQRRRLRGALTALLSSADPMPTGDLAVAQPSWRRRQPRTCGRKRGVVRPPRGGIGCQARRSAESCLRDAAEPSGPRSACTAEPSRATCTFAVSAATAPCCLRTRVVGDPRRRSGGGSADLPTAPTYGGTDLDECLRCPALTDGRGPGVGKDDGHSASDFIGWVDVAVRQTRREPNAVASV